MLNQRLSAAKSVATDLFTFETALDQAIVAGSKLSSQIIGARFDANLSAVLGQDAIEGVMRTLTTIAAARRELIETHHRLKDVADEIGLRTVSFGDGLKGPASAVHQESSPLRSVA